MVSIGGVAVRRIDGQHVRGEEFYFELKPVSEGFDAHAMSIHGISRAHLEENGVDAREALIAITEWVETIRGDAKCVLWVTMPHSTGCMLPVFCLGGSDNPFGYNALDTKALMMGRLARRGVNAIRNDYSRCFLNSPHRTKKTSTTRCTMLSFKLIS